MADNTQVKFTLSPEEENSWHQFCRDLKSDRPDQPNPDKSDYLIFCKQLADAKRIRDAAPELLATLEQNSDTLKTLARTMEIDSGAYKLVMLQAVANGLTIKKAKGKS